MAKCIFLLCLVIYLSANAVELKHIRDPGISLALAECRKQQLTDISYKLKFRIPDHLEDRIEADEILQFDLKDTSAPVLIDAQNTKSNPLLEKAMTVNSQPFAISVLNDHIEIPKNLLRVGTNSIAISFIAGETGLHRRDNFLYTLMVPDNASKTFPCFDQPDLKAIYKLTLQIPKDWKAVSQGSVISTTKTGEFTTVEFSETKPTSTYLFAFAAGQFKTIERNIDGRPVTMFHLETDQHKVDRNVDAIFEIHAKALRWMEDFTGIPFPFEKFDFVLLPAFPFSGMEHPGSIFYSDKSLLLDESATQSQFLSRANVIAHETSHIWFGDLVTMNWFNDVWLKEVFANFMADKIADPLFPNLNHDVRFLLAHYPSAYRVDRTKGTTPIAQKLENLNEASTLYGDIIYDKAPIAMRQLEKYVGPEEFHKGLQEYLETYKFKNASWSNLIQILSHHTKKPLKKWNHDWIESSGRPTLSTEFQNKLKNPEIILKSMDQKQNHLVWPQTLNLALGSGEKPIILPVAIDNSITKITPPPQPNHPDFILTDAKDPGYGLFLLDKPSVEFISDHLMDIKDEGVRAVAWVDVIQNLIERRIPPEYFIDLAIKTLPKEKNEQIIDMVLKNIGSIYWALLPETVRNKYSPDLEKMLWDRISSTETTKLARTSFFKSYQSLLMSEEAWSKLYDIWKGKRKLKDITFSESDFMTMAYELSLRKNPVDPKIIESQLERIKDPERKKEFQFVIRAASGSQTERDELFQKILSDDATRRNEPWIRDALYYLHHPLHGLESEKYVEQSLEVLPKIKQTGGIFFPLDWLNGNLGFHITRNTRKVVENYLKTHPDLEKGLKLKLLQASDTLMRFTDEQ